MRDTERRSIAGMRVAVFLVAAWAGLAVLAGTCRAQAEAWTLKEGAYRVVFGFSRIDTRQEYTVHGTRGRLYSEFASLSDGEYDATDFTLHAEYGISSQFTIVGETQLRQATAAHVDSVLVQRPNSGLGDVYVAGRLNVLDAPVSVSAQVGWKIPAADTGSLTAVALGNGVMDFDGVVALGSTATIAGNELAVQGRYGMCFHGGSLAGSIVYGAEILDRVWNGKVGVRVSFDGEITQGPVPGGIQDSPPLPGFALTNNHSAAALTGGLRVRASQKLQFFFDWKTVVDGRAVIAGNTATFGIMLTPAGVHVPGI